MPLPFPHGTASGEIGHNSLIDLTDTPGSVGGRFVGFGEEGTSAIANRASWALSANIDYVYQKIQKAMSVMDMASWTVSGGTGLSYTFIGATKVWCGDGTYPSGQEGLDYLFSLLDANYNQLTDASGNKVVVRTVRNGSDVDMFGTGFVTTPIIKFKTVNPVTGADVTNPYTIPDGTAVKIIHAREGNLETLPTDALTRSNIRTAEEIAAGVLLQDGSRPMRATLNMGGYGLSNVLQVASSSGIDLAVAGSGGASLLVSGFAEISLSDSRDTALLSNAGEDLTRGTNNSILGSLSDAYQLNRSMHGNRVRTKSGSFTFTDGSGRVDYPSLDIILNGDHRTIAGGYVMAVASTATILVVSSAGSLVQRAPSAVVSTDIPIAYYYWSGSAFTTKIDIRWPLIARTSGLEVTVGSDGTGALMPGCDFADLESAVGLSTAMSVTAFMGHSFTIKLRGTSLVPNTIVPKAYIRIIGEGGAILKATHAISADTINAYGSAYPVEIRDVQFLWGNTSNGTGTSAALADLTSQSVVSGCTFVKDSGSSTSFRNALAWNGYSNKNILIERCSADVSYRFISAGGVGAVPTMNMLVDSSVRDCRVMNTTGAASTVYAIDVPGAGNLVANCQVDSSSGNGFDYGIRIGDRGQALKNYVYGTATGYGYVFMTDDTNTANSGLFSGNVAVNTGMAFGSVITSSFTARRHHVTYVGNRATTSSLAFGVLNDATRAQDGCSYKFLGNTIDGATSDGMYVNNARSILVQGNLFRNVGVYAIEVAANTIADVCDNDIEGFTTSAVWLYSTSTEGSQIHSNRIRASGAGATDVMLQVDQDRASIYDNQLVVDAGQTCGTAISLSTNAVQIKGNRFYGFGNVSGLGGCVAATASGTAGTGLSITGNVIEGMVDTNIAVNVAGYDGTIVEGNHFGAGNYVAVYGWDNSLSCQNMAVRGNDFTLVAGDNILSANCNVVMVAPTGTASGTLIEGNTFLRCGSTNDVYSFPIMVGGSGGSVRGNVFTNTYGRVASTATYGTYVINVAAGKFLIEGNKFYQDLAVVMPRHLYCINVESTGNVIQNNFCELTDSIGTWTNGIFRFIRSVTQNDTVCQGNVFMHHPGSLTGGSDVVAIEVTGQYCNVSMNRVQRYGIVADGGYSVVVGNQVLNSNLSDNGAHSVVIGNSVPDGTINTVGTMHPDSTTTYSASTKTPALDVNHYSGD